MPQSLYENENTRYNYLRLDDLKKSVVNREYETCFKECNLQMEALTDKIPDEQLIKTFLIPDEDLIPIKTLTADRYDIRLATDPYSEKFIDFGFDVNMYLSNKRLILLDSGEYHHPILQNHENGGKIERTEVGCSRKDSTNFTAFPLNSIYGISLKLENDISNTSIVKKVSGTNIGLIILGAILAIVGLILTGQRGAEGIGYIFLIIGIILAIAGYLQKSEDVSGPQQDIQKTRVLRIVTLDPIYKNRASLSIKIDTNKNDVKSIIQWSRELQNRCDPICNSKAFETIMNV